MTLTASITCGCGNKPNPDNAAGTGLPTVEESSEASEETEPTSEPQATAQPEKVPEATPAPESTETREPVSDLPEDESETEESKEDISTDQTNAVDASVSVESTAVPETGSTDAVANSEQATYSVTEMSATMYVVNAVNLRQGPGTEYAKVGNLAKGQQVAVTGQAGNGWYQLDNGAFVSNKYLSSTAPAQQVAGTAPVAPADTTGTVIPVGTETESFGGTSVDFINYLNQQRAAAGLSTLTWDDDLAQVAQRRAQELTVDNSHNGCPADCSEIIYMGGSSYTDWYNAWYNSQGHRESMFREDQGTAACAYYYHNYNYFVVTLFKQRERTQEELDAIMNPDNMVQIGDNVYIDKETYDALTNSGVSPSLQPDEETNQKIDEQQKLLEQGVIDRIIE